MRHMILGSLVAGTLAVATIPASAMPMDGIAAQPLPAATADTQPGLTLVSGGCGWYRHRGWNGLCYPNGYGWGVGYRPWGWRGYGWGWHRWGWHRWGWHRW